MAGKDVGLKVQRPPNEQAFQVGDCVLVSGGILTGLTGIVSGTSGNRRYVITPDGWSSDVRVSIVGGALERLGPLRD